MQVSEEKNLEQQIIASLLISPRKIEIAEELGLLEVHFFDGFNPYSSGFSIYFVNINRQLNMLQGFNPYSSGFSIYFITTNSRD